MIDALYSDRILKLAANMPRAGRLAAPQGTAEEGHDAGDVSSEVGMRAAYRMWKRMMQA